VPAKSSNCLSPATRKLCILGFLSSSRDEQLFHRLHHHRITGKTEAVPSQLWTA
jgi:hypothetical protein